jgi:hypothetical protein
MSLLINTSGIVIQNSAGQTKFTSNEKLLYQKAVAYGSVSIGPYNVFVPLNTRLVPTDILILTVNISSASGQTDFTNTIIGKDMPANGGIIVDFHGRNVSNQAAVDSEVLGIDLVNLALAFKTVRYTNLGAITNGTTTVNLSYYARIWSYL